MIIRAIDENLDWTFGKGKQNYKTELDALKQDCETKLRSWKGDCFFSPSEGVDWNNFLDIGTKDFLDRDIKRVILQTEGVLKIIKNTFVSTISDRNYNAECDIQTIYGRLTITL